jgi:hypothetical protein
MPPIRQEHDADLGEPRTSPLAGLSWSRIYQFRHDAARRLGPLYSLPIIKRASDILMRNTNAHDRVLEIGAGDRRMCSKLQQAHGQVHYESLDPDPLGDHDYRELAEVVDAYDLVVAFEVIEHLGVDEIIPWLQALRERTRDGGRLVLSTPNTYYPPAYLRDATHRTPLCYDELAGLCMAAGWHVEQVFRVYHEPLARVLVRRYLFGWMFRLLGLDFARQIVLVGRKSEFSA